MTRRTFVAATAAAASAQRATAQDQVQVGVVGVGGRGRSLTGLLTRFPDVKIGWIVDADQASLERAQMVIQDAGAAQPKTADDMRRVFDDSLRRCRDRRHPGPRHARRRSWPATRAKTSTSREALLPTISARGGS